MDKTEAPKPEAKGAKWWLDTLEADRKRESDWRKRARRVVQRYRDERSEGAKGAKMNVLWSNTDVLLAALYQETPKPDIRRRWKEGDAVGRIASQSLERAISFQLDHYNFDAIAEAGLLDYLLSGRGQIRVFYEPVIVADGEYEEIADAKFRCEQVPWDLFGMSAGRDWSEVSHIFFIHYFDKDQAREAFGGQHANAIPYTFSEHRETGEDAYMRRRSEQREENEDHRARVYEVWDKRNRVRLYVAEGYDKILKHDDDPYNLEDFYPVPEPLYSVKTSDSMIPVPEMTLYQDQLEELDIITGRIFVLLQALKRRGVYDSSMKELARLADADDNEFLPVDNYASMMEKGGLASLMVEAPLEGIVRTLQQLYQSREATLATIFELTGISDIMRGTSADRETATTSRMKGGFGSLRLVNRKRRVIRFFRDLVRIKAELMAEHIEPETLQMMTQVPMQANGEDVTAQVMGVIRNDRTRAYRVDIETESSIAVDDHQEKTDRLEALTAVGQFMAQVQPMVEAGVMPFEVAKSLVLFGLRGFKQGREFEEMIEQLQPAPPKQEGEDPAAALAAAEREKAQLEAQSKSEKLALQAQIEQFKAKLAAANLNLKTEEMSLNQKLAISSDAQAERKIDIQQQQVDDNFELGKERLDVELEKTLIQQRGNNNAAD
jgi:hypothetical protein